MRRIDSDLYKVLKLKSREVDLKCLKLGGLAGFHKQIRLTQAGRIHIYIII
jgi:hypothetical protein